MRGRTSVRAVETCRPIGLWVPGKGRVVDGMRVPPSTGRGGADEIADVLRKVAVDDGNATGWTPAMDRTGREEWREVWDTRG